MTVFNPLHWTRKIRACEGEVAAQLALEQAVEMARRAVPPEAADTKPAFSAGVKWGREMYPEDKRSEYVQVRREEYPPRSQVDEVIACLVDDSDLEDIPLEVRDTMRAAAHMLEMLVLPHSRMLVDDGDAGDNSQK